MHPSSWLGYSWECVDIVNSARVHSQGTSDDGCRTIKVLKGVSRREKFRTNAGPCREELLWLQIVSILRKISVPTFLPSAAGRINEQQAEKNVFDTLALDGCQSSGSPQARKIQISALESPTYLGTPCVEKHYSQAGNGVLSHLPHLENTLIPPSSSACNGNRQQLESTTSLGMPSVEKDCSRAGNGVLPHVPRLERTLISPSSSECDGNPGCNAIHQQGSSVSGDSSNLREVKLKELLQSVSWPFAAVGDMESLGSFDISWEKLPESADPMRGSGYKASLKGEEERQIDRNGREGEEEDDSGHGDCCMGRGERKRLQVGNIASALSSFQLKAGSRIVDFGCGSGALTLPLAALFAELSFVGVDFKQQSVTLLEERARKAKLGNVTAFYGRIEKFSEPFDACVALHACGIATDLALLQALKHRAAYVMSPCCIGKLQINIQKVMLNSAKHMQTQKNMPSVPILAGTDSTLSNTDSPSSNLTDPSRSVDSNNEMVIEGSNPDTQKRFDNDLAQDQACGPSEIPVPVDLRESISLRLAYPRSEWLRSSISENEFQVLARAADWSSYDRETSTSRLHSLCKVVLELDRNEASRELGYCTGLFSLSNEKAGTVGVSHVLVGRPQEM